MENNLFALRIKELRLKHNVTQKELGSYIGISMQTVNDIEQSRSKTTLDRAKLLADFFDVSLDYLVGRTSNPVINYSESELKPLYSDNPSLFIKVFSSFIQKIPSDAYTAMLELINALDKKSNIRYLETGQPDFSYYDSDWKPVIGSEIHSRLFDAIFDNGIITLFFEDGSKHIFSFNEENIFLNTNMLSKIYYHDHKRNQDFRIIFE